MILVTSFRDKSCVSGTWNSENDTTHGQNGSTIHCSNPPADQSGKARILRHRQRHSRRHPREDRREDVAVSVGVVECELKSVAS